MAATSQIIRAMQAHDLDAVLEIEQLSFPRPWSRQSYEHELYNNKYSLMLVLERDGGITLAPDQ